MASEWGDKKFNSSYVEENNDYVLAPSGQKISVNEYKEYPVANAVPVAQAKTQKLFVNDANSFEFKTKKEIKIPASKAPVFKAGRGLKDAVK